VTSRRATVAWWALAVATVALGCAKQRPAPVPAAPVPAAAPATSPQQHVQASPPVADETPDGEAPELAGEERDPDPAASTVTVELVADPKRKARVLWGRKDLGFAPLTITRPRGSGPLDLLVTAPGFLPLHTRAFTDRDDKLVLHLHPESEAPALLGYHP
jgi:hypothetical protein